MSSHNKHFVNTSAINHGIASCVRSPKGIGLTRQFTGLANLVKRENFVEPSNNWNVFQGAG